MKTLVENPICRAISESVALQDSENEYIQHPIILGALHFVDKTKSRLGKDEKCEGSMVPRSAVKLYHKGNTKGVKPKHKVFLRGLHSSLN